MSRSFFNQIAIGEDADLKNFLKVVDDMEADRRSAEILEMLTPVAETDQVLVFQETKNTWAFKSELGAHASVSYSAELNQHIVEVLDAPPQEFNNEICVERIIAIHDKTKGLGGKGTVFMRLSPLYSPDIHILISKSMSNKSFICKGALVANVMDVTEKIIEATDKAVPQPSWVETFHENFVIKRDESGKVVRRRATQPES